jgi:metallophosphoesterase superfamily enzyme
MVGLTGKTRPFVCQRSVKTSHFDRERGGWAQRMHIDARRALFWPQRNALVVADVHLGKASLLRQAGAALPSGTTTQGLAHLSSLIADYRPQRLFILGDLVHGEESLQAAWLAIFAAWRDAHAALELLLITGNHDKRATLDQLGVDRGRRMGDRVPSD